MCNDFYRNLSHFLRKKPSLITLFVYTASGVLNLTVPRTITGKQLKRLVLNRIKSSNRGFSYHALLYNNQRIDVGKPIGTSIPNNSSIVLQVIGKGGGRQPKKQQSASDEIPGKQISTIILL